MTMVWNRMARLTVVLVLLLGLSVVGPLSASAQQGRGDAVKLCQKGGFQELQGEGGVRFANQRDCITHVVQGGTVTQAPSLFLWYGFTGWDGSITGTGFTPGSLVTVSYTYGGLEWVMDSTPQVDGNGTFVVGDDLGWCVDALRVGPTTTLTAYDSTGVVIHSETIDLTTYCS